MGNGIGHKLKPGESFPNGITRNEALRLLQDDTVLAEATVKKSVTVNLTQSQFDALVSFTYNVGPSAFKKSLLLRLINRGDYESAARQFMQWNKIRKQGRLLIDDGLTNRRRNERDLFLNGKYQ